MDRQEGWLLSPLPDFWPNSLRLFGLAASLLLIACNGNAEGAVGSRAASGHPEKSVVVEPDLVVTLPEKKERLLPGASKSAPMTACPSQDFEAFLQSFANSADIQAAYTSESSTHKYPYHWKHNAEPGDPAYPKWVAEEDRSVGRVKYRYDSESKKFIWVGKRLKDGQHWISIKADEKPVSFAQLPEFEIRRVSSERYDVEYDNGEVDSYELKSGCWRFIQHLEFDRIMSCRWPDQCRACREWEGEGDKRDLCGAL